MISVDPARLIFLIHISPGYTPVISHNRISTPKRTDHNGIGSLTYFREVPAWRAGLPIARVTPRVINTPP
jgi:hypothetical protein